VVAEWAIVTFMYRAVVMRQSRSDARFVIIEQLDRMNRLLHDIEHI
jgi:hypothetical protein